MERLRVSTKWWNALVRDYFRNRLRAVTVIEAEPWRHPWYSDLRWDVERERWAVRTVPGYCVVPRLATAEVRVPGGVRLDGPPLVATEEDPEAATAPRLTEPGVALPIAPGVWRAVGTDAPAAFGEEGAEAVPPFFQALGVLVPGEVVADAALGTFATSQAGLATDRSDARLLRACDLVLQVDRPAARLDWTIGDGVTSAEILTAAVTIGSAPDARPWPFLRVRQAASDPETLAPDSAEVLALGGLMQAPYDARRLATLYLLSEPGARPGSVPDATWTGYVRQEVEAHWNFQHETTIRLGDVAPPPIQVPVPGLGAGTLGAIGNVILSAANAQVSLLSALVAGARVRGDFYTAG